MRRTLDPELLCEALRALGRLARGPGRVYVTGGASALLFGWRDSTVDLDLRLDPEPRGMFEGLRDIKRSMDINIELASPSDFIPELPGWRELLKYPSLDEDGFRGRVTLFVDAEGS